MPLKSVDALKSEVSHILDLVKPFQVTQAEVGVSHAIGLSVNVRLGELETVEYQQDQSFGITLYRGQARGSASTTDTSESSIQATIQAAYDMAGYTQEDDCAGLANLEDLAENPPELACYYPHEITPEKAAESACTLEAYAMSQDKRIINSDGASYNTQSGTRVYGNSHGFLEGYQTSRYSTNCTVLAEGKNGQMERDYGYTIARDPQDLCSYKRVGDEAASRTLKRLDAVQPETMHVPVLFDSRVAGSMIGHFLAAISGGNLYRHSSFLLNSKGEQIFPDWVTIEDQPFLKKALGSRPFDSEGVSPQQRFLVEEGRVQGYLLGSYSARKLGLKTTGNAGGYHNILVSDSGQDTAELIKKMDRGVFVTDLIGQGVNIVTGDYSRGASGFWVEGGKIQYPLQEMTIAGQLKPLFERLVAIGSDRETRGSIQVGSMLFDQMTIAGK